VGEHRGQGGFRPLWLALVVALALGGAGFMFREDISALFRSEDRPRAAPSPVPGPTATTSPSPVPSPTPTEEPRGRLLIHGTGDVNLDPSYIPALAANGYAHAWSGLRGLFRQDDLTAVNLECAVSDLGTAVPKEFNFRCDPAALPATRRAGVEVANLGNNHAYDYGPEALLDSIVNLRRNRITPVGAGRNAKAALAPALFELNGWTVAVVGIDQVVDPFPEAVAAPGHPGTAAGHDTDAMIKAIRDARRQADLVIVTIHWGVELDTEPRPEQVELGHAFVDAGADVIFGHHAHRLQPMDHYLGRPIFWGLGNFVWPNFSAEGSNTAVARVVVTPGGRVRGELLPAHIESAGHPVLTG
jgi:poly-gamma-glutamate capsule biosynthesis protein CapA/YwtB (metallophosphatase superfamily)